MKRTSKRVPGRSRGGYRTAGELRSLSTGLPQLAAARDHADSPPLARAKSQWLVGDWNALCELDADTIASHPERDRLALLVACAHQQRADHELAREYTRRAIGWGCDPKLVARLLISGVHNTLGRVAALKADDSSIDSHFTQALAVTGDAESGLATPTRAVRELADLGLLPQAAGLLLKQVAAIRQEPLRPLANHTRIQSLADELERLQRAQAQGVRSVSSQIKLRSAIEAYPSLVILATQRSGSTLLCDYLYQNNCGKPDEHILANFDGDQLLDFLENRIESISLAFDNQRFTENCIYKSIFSIKIMIGYLPQFLGLVSVDDLPKMNENSHQQFLRIFSGSEFIVISRQDILSQAISRVMAANTGVCHFKANDSTHIDTAVSIEFDAKHKVIFSYRSIFNEIEKISLEYLELDALTHYLSINNEAVTKVCYEDFVDQGYCSEQLSYALNRILNRSNPLGKEKILTMAGAGGTFSSSLLITANKYNTYFATLYRKIDETLNEQSISVLKVTDEHLLSVTLKTILTCNEVDPEWALMQARYIEDNTYL